MASVAIVGPGAIGGVMTAALLGREDHDVVVCARTPFDRLTFERDGVTTDHEVRVVTSPDGLGPVDVVVLATKTFHTAAAADTWFGTLCGPDTVVAALQNGVEHRERLEPLIGPAALAPTIVFCPADRTGPGVVSLGGRAALAMPDDEMGARAAAIFDDTFVDVRLTPDWLTDAWAKLLSNCAGGAVATLARTSNAVLADPGAAELVLALMEEAAEVGRAEGAVLPDDIAPTVLAAIMARASNHTSSIVVDRIEGRPTEWRERNEVVVRLAERHGIDVPLNRAMTTLLRLGEPQA